MLRYLQAAFFFRPEIPGLGAVPINLVGVICFLILGLGHPALWLIGIALELTYLFTMMTSPRFQRLVVSRQESVPIPESGWRESLQELSPDNQARMLALEARHRHVLEIYRKSGVAKILVESNRSAIEKLLSSYGELLRFEQTLRSLEDRRAAEGRLTWERAKIERALADEEELSPEARNAKEATLKTISKRLEAIRRRDASLEEISSHLARIEAQMDLALEDAAAGNRPERISAEIDVATFMLDDLFGGRTLEESRPASPRQHDRT